MPGVVTVQKDPKASATGEPLIPEAAPSLTPPALTPPALAAEADDLEEDRAAVVDAAGVSAGLWLSYLFLLFYLLIAEAGVSHRDLFFESPVKLPFLNVDLPLKVFFGFGPALFLIVHTYVLLHFVMLAGKVRMFDIQLRKQIEDPEVRTRRRRRLPINIFVQFLAGPGEVRDGIMGILLWLIALISLVIGPVALLVFFQLQFLPYHDHWITLWQRLFVALELALLWKLWPRVGPISTGEARRRSLVEVIQRIGTIVAMLLITVISVPFVFAIATFPGEPLEDKLSSLQPLAPLREWLVAGEVDFATRKPTSWWSNRLVLPGLDAIDHTKFDTEAKIAAATETVSLRARHLEGAVLIGAVLRKADFTGAYLERAQLTTADLRDADFTCSGSAESRSGLFVSLQPGKRPACTQLQGADLKGARLQGADLKGARLQGANLTAAELHGVDLKGARLEWADLTLARLQGADLGGAQLQGASLHAAQLQGASLVIAELEGADLVAARLQGANLDAAQLQGADLSLARLQGAALRNVFVWRADARSADAKDAWIDTVVSGPKQWCGNRNGPVGCDWSDVWWSDFKKRIEQEFPHFKKRIEQEFPQAAMMPAQVLKRLDPRLDPAKPLKDEAEMAQRWSELQSSSLTRSAYEKELFNQWQRIGCAVDGAPYVLTALIKRLQYSMSPFEYNSPELERLEAEFLKEDCAGARGLSEDIKEKLKELSATSHP
jgi:uncharacterized protein YjbI with pentapeptide repeats